MIFGLFSCIEGEKESLNRSDSELILQLKSDEFVQSFFSEQLGFKKTISEKIISLNVPKQLIEASNLTEIAESLELPKGTFESREVLFEELIAHLYIKFPELMKMNEDRFFHIISNSKDDNFSNFQLGYLKSENNRIFDACDNQFAEDFNRIHNNYDFSVIMCFAIAGVSGHAGVITCEATAMVNMMLQMAQAMDNHTLCKAEN